MSQSSYKFIIQLYSISNQDPIKQVAKKIQGPKKLCNYLLQKRPSQSFNKFTIWCHSIIIQQDPNKHNFPQCSMLCTEKNTPDCSTRFLQMCADFSLEDLRFAGDFSCLYLGFATSPHLHETHQDSGGGISTNIVFVVLVCWKLFRDTGPVKPLYAEEAAIRGSAKQRIYMVTL